MNKYPLIGGSICAVVLIVLASFTNVVGYQTVQSSNQKMINSEIDQKELLFQTIVDIANNKQIEKVILGSEITGKKFFDPEMRFSTFTPPVLTEKFLKRMYTMGVILSKTISKSKIHSIVQHYQIINPVVQKEINAVIKRDATLKEEIMQLSFERCNCEMNSTAKWGFPVICGVLLVLFLFSACVWLFTGIAFSILLEVISEIHDFFKCNWPLPYYP
jgi:hypothetical protein